MNTENKSNSVIAATAVFSAEYQFYLQNGAFPLIEKAQITYFSQYHEDIEVDISKEYYYSSEVFIKYLEKKYPKSFCVLNCYSENSILVNTTFQIQENLLMSINYNHYMVEEFNGKKALTYRYYTDMFGVYESFRTYGIGEVSFYYNEKSKQTVLDLFRYLLENREEVYKVSDPTPVVSSIGIICKDTNGYFYIADKEFKQDSDKYYDFDLDIHYGPGFTEEFHNILIDRLNKRSNGIILFHGAPGTGKTFYIRRLIKELYNNSSKKVIIVPNTFTNEITSPEFFDFLRSYVQDSNLNLVLIMEDAENLLRKRNSRNSFDAVSNILNMTDGLLNDIIGIQIIATFNTELENIDTALLRHKRLLAKNEFKRLTKEQAVKLAEYIKIPENDIKKMNELTYSVAEVYSLIEKEQDNKLIR